MLTSPLRAASRAPPAQRRAVLRAATRHYASAMADLSAVESDAAEEARLRQDLADAHQVRGWGGVGSGGC